MATAYDALKNIIARIECSILDGGVGTELQFRGIEMDETWCGSASLNTQVLEQIHLDYINAGAEVMKQFTASCTADIDFAGGDDIVDGDSLAVAAGTYLTAGSNGQTNIVSTGAANLIGETIPADANTAPVTITAADTIDVTIAGAAAATGRLRVFAVIADVSAAHREAAVASRDNV